MFNRHIRAPAGCLHLRICDGGGPLCVSPAAPAVHASGLQVVPLPPVQVKCVWQVLVIWGLDCPSGQLYDFPLVAFWVRHALMQPTWFAFRTSPKALSGGFVCCSPLSERIPSLRSVSLQYKGEVEGMKHRRPFRFRFTAMHGVRAGATRPLQQLPVGLGSGPNPVSISQEVQFTCAPCTHGSSAQYRGPPAIWGSRS